jgi:hypothetical protein
MSDEPETNLTTDRSLLLPILLGVFSLCGILLVFVIGRINSSRSPLPVLDTATPFKYQLIGTEPGISTAEPTLDPNSPENSDLSPLGMIVTAQAGAWPRSAAYYDSLTKASLPVTHTETEPSITLNPATTSIIPTVEMPTTSLPPLIGTSIPTDTNLAPTLQTATATVRVTGTNTLTGVSTASTQVPLAPGTYDDSHPLLTYNGWSIITDSTAYQSTLHVSNIVGSYMTFRFTGQQLHVRFQDSASFGFLRINVGGLDFDLDESTNDSNDWVSAMLAKGTYTVTITHISGGSVNIDSIYIPDFNTPTPTVTVTNTPLNQ